MNLKTLGQRIVHVRKNVHPMSQVELSQRTGIKQGTLSKIERDKTMSTGSVTIIAEVLGVLPKWLAQGIGPMGYSKRTDGVNLNVLLEDVEVLQFADSRCEHGPNYNSTVDQLLDLVAFPRQVLEKLNLNVSDCIAYLATDESMQNAIRLGDHLLIDVTSNSPAKHSGRIFAIANGSTLQFRYIHSTPEGGYRLLTDNTADKNAYPDIEMDKANISQLNIVGMVRWIAGER